MRSSLCRAELPLITQEPICRIVDGGVEVPRLEKWSLRKPGVPKASVRIGGRYVVTGGSGALGSACVKWLLGQGAGQIVILSRSKPLYDPQAEPVLWLKCDVSIAAELRACAEEIRKGGEVCGIIHAAGVLADKLLAKQTEENIQKAFGPKVLAALLLPKLLDPKDFVVFFSSVAACLGSPGQVPYAAANGALDGYSNHAAANDHNGLRTLSIQWGPWKDAGMAANESVLRRAHQHGFGAWTTKEGIAMLNHLLSSGATHNVCVAKKGDLEGSESLSSHVFAANSATASDGFEDLEERVKTVVEDLIGVSIELDSDLNESGLDSLAAAELSTKLSAALQVKLFPTLLSTASTLRELQQCVREETTALWHKPMDITKEAPLATTSNTSSIKLPILVVGAGVGGITFAHQLASAGEHVIVMEKSNELGGSWYLGNESSRLQIDSPSYMLDYDDPVAWPSTYPTKNQVIEHVKSEAKKLSDLRVQHTVQSIEAKHRGGGVGI